MLLANAEALHFVAPLTNLAIAHGDEAAQGGKHPPLGKLSADHQAVLGEGLDGGLPEEAGGGVVVGGGDLQTRYISKKVDVRNV